MTELVALLNQSLDPNTAREAEKQLKGNEARQGFPLELLAITNNTSVAPGTRLAAALFFKNLIRRKWTDADSNYLLNPNDVVTIKTEIISLMISLPHSLQAQLGEAISIIADSDFPDRWENLVPSLVERLSTNPESNNGVLVVAHSIFRRWRPLFRSDALFKEIALVLGQFAQPFLELLRATNEKIKSNPPLPELKLWLESMNQLVKIFYDLNCQDLPEFFEDHLEEFMSILQENLVYENSAIAALTDDDDAGILEEIKAGICEILQLYTQRYDEEFSKPLPQFVNSTWTLLTTVSLAPRYDLLVNRALGFLTYVAKVPRQIHMFESDDVLTQIIEKIVIPNMTLRESDEELYEDDPMEYTRRDLEGSDSDTRRRAATDFLRELATLMDAKVTSIVMRYVDSYIEQYNQNPSANWRYKNTAAYLFSSIAAKGNFTAAGVSTTNLLIDVVGFFNRTIAPDLIGTSQSTHPILQVDAIKFIHNFRNQLTKEQLSQALPLLVQLLNSKDYVVYTYAAITIERILSIRQNNGLMFTRADVEAEAPHLIKNLMRLILRHHESPEKLSENEFLIKCIMRVLITIQDGSKSFGDTLLPQLVNITEAISANPANPRFTHFLFESIGALIRFNGPHIGEAKLEESVVRPFLQILGQDITEFVPYVLQILTEVLKIQPQNSLPDSFRQLTRPLLAPVLWESRGNVPALVGQLEAILSHGANIFIEDGLLQPLLGVFQNLIASKANDLYGFGLLEYIFLYIPREQIAPLTREIAQLLLVRLQSSRTDKYVARFARFMYFLAAGDPAQGLGPEMAIQFLDQVQDGVFGQIMNSFLLPNTLKINGGNDRRIAAIGLTKLLAQTEEFTTGKYSSNWTNTLVTLIGLMKTNIAEKSSDAPAEFDIQEISFGSSFSKLSSTASKPLDPAPQIEKPQPFFVAELKTLSQRFGPAIGQQLHQLPAESLEYLKTLEVL